MNEQSKGIKRTIGLDLHPDLFTAAALLGSDPAKAETLWVRDRLSTQDIVRWAQEELTGSDVIVIEASGNSFSVAADLRAAGFITLVLESAQAGRIRENYCNDDRSSAVKLARIYLTGLAKIVWQPDPLTRERRDLFFAYRNSVRDCTRNRNRIRSYLNGHQVRLPRGTRLTQPSGLNLALAKKKWSPVEQALIRDAFVQLWENEKRRREFNRLIAQEVLNDPKLRSLLRLMGVKHIVAFAVGALVGDINRFPTAKKLSGYIGLAPGRKQSGNNPQGRQMGIPRTGRSDLRSLLLQSAQNALAQKDSPMHAWGWKLLFRKGRNKAAVAVARKIAVSIWHLLKGHFTPLTEPTPTISVKVSKIASFIGLQEIKQRGYPSKAAFVEAQLALLTQQT